LGGVTVGHAADGVAERLFANSSRSLSSVEVQKLFDRFYTVEAARKSTGLGLSIARALTERMGGELTAEYREGKLYITAYLPE